MRGGNIQSLSGLLLKYKNLKAPQGSVVKVFVEVIGRVCGVTIRESLVRYNVSTKAVHIALSGPGKNEILLKKQVILAACREKLGDQTPTTLL